MIWLKLLGKETKKNSLSSFALLVAKSILKKKEGTIEVSPLLCLSRPLVRAEPGLKYSLMHASDREGYQPCQADNCDKKSHYRCGGCRTAEGTGVQLCQTGCHLNYHRQLLASLKKLRIVSDPAKVVKRSIADAELEEEGLEEGLEALEAEAPLETLMEEDPLEIEEALEALEALEASRVGEEAGEVEEESGQVPGAAQLQKVIALPAPPIP